MGATEIGIFMIFASVILNTAVLKALPILSDNPTGVINILVPAYFIAASFMLLWQRYRKLPIVQSKLRFIYSITWGAIIFSVYYILLFHANKLTVTQLLIAQSTSPYFAVFVSGDWRNLSPKDLLKDSAPLLLLFPIAAIASSGSSGGALLYFFVILVLFTFSQSISRYAAKDPSQASLSQCLGFFWVGIWMLIWLNFKHSAHNIASVNLFASLSIGSALYLIQLLFLVGLQLSSPILGALASSSSVPLAVALQSLDQRKVSWLSLVLSALYCFAIVLKAKQKSAKILTP